MILPASVRIAYLTCPVKPMAADGPELSGRFDEDTGVIEIASGHSDPLLVDALLHEMVHAMLYLGNAGLEPDTEERVVRVLTTQLLSAMRDNSELFVAMMQTVRG